MRAPSGGRVDLLIAALAAALPADGSPVVLVLDDFHEVADTVHADLERLLRHPLPGLRLVIASRADPPLHLGRLRLQDQLAEIRSPDLAFTLDETGEMLAALGIDVDDDDVRRLWTHTEGWVGAIRLAAMSLRDHPEPARFIADFAGDDRAISDYLLSEVMSAVSAEDRDFLLSTAVAGVLNGELADALTGARDGHRRLAELAARRRAARPGRPARRVVSLSRAVRRAAAGRAAQRAAGRASRSCIAARRHGSPTTATTAAGCCTPSRREPGTSPHGSRASAGSTC